MFALVLYAVCILTVIHNNNNYYYYYYRFPSIKELQGLLGSDGKRPDGLTLIPWQDGRCATCDVTVTDTVAASYVSRSASCAGSAAEAAATRKEEKYSDISESYLFSL